MEIPSDRETARNGDQEKMTMISVLILTIKGVLTSKVFLAIFVSLLIISLSVTYVASESRARQSFLGINTLGSNMAMENYYPGETSMVNVGDNISWYVNVYNRMGEPEYLSVRVKLLNSTHENPDAVRNIPSPEDHIFETKQLLMNNSTWTIPLSWTLTEIEKQENYAVIRSLTMNGMDVNDLNVRSADGNNFRMVIELWRYDRELGDFSFAWSSDADKSSVWNQIWFNVS